MFKKSLLRSMAIMMLLALALRFCSPAYAALSEVGPIDPVNGFPEWYKDSTGLALKFCDDPAFCTFLTAELPNPGAPMSFPDNYPGEMFWWTGEADIGFVGGSALLIMAVEGSFFSGIPVDGDQITFSRIRLKINGLVAGGQYTITHPYGVLNLVADAGGVINYVSDIGIGAPGDPGGFALLLGGPVGPFLVWDETQSVIDPDIGLPIFTPPAGFIGDVNIAHQVTGSSFNTNFFKIEGPGLGLNGISTDLFIVTGKTSTVVQPLANLQVDHAEYSWPAVGTPQAQIYVTAQDPLSQLVVSSAGGAITPLALPINMDQITIPGDPLAVPPIPDQPTNLYLVNVDLNSAVPLIPDIAITDLSLNQALRATLTDVVTITEASFDLATSVISIRASSSDEVTLPVLVVVGANPTGDIGPPDNIIDPITGFTHVLLGPPSSVTVQSSLGGVATARVRLTGPGSTNYALPFAPPVADPGPPQNVFVDTRVDLSAAASTGIIYSFSWVQIGVDADGNTVAISNPTSSDINFIFPNTVNPRIPLTFEVTVAGPGGVSLAQVVVTPVVAPPVIPTIDRAAAKDVAPGGKGEWRIDGTISPIVAGATVDIIVFDPSTPGVTQTLATGVPVEAALGIFQFGEKGITLTIPAITLSAIAISHTGSVSAAFPIDLQ